MKKIFSARLMKALTVAIIVADLVLVMWLIADRISNHKAADEYACTLEYRYVDNGEEVAESETFSYKAYGAFPENALKDIDGYHYYILPNDSTKKSYTAWYYQTDNHFWTYATVPDDIGRVSYVKNTSDNLQRKETGDAPYELKTN